MVVLMKRRAAAAYSAIGQVQLLLEKPHRTKVPGVPPSVGEHRLL